MSYLYPTVKRAVALVLSLTVIFQVSFSQLAFNNPVLVSGTDLEQGAVYRYDNVAPFVRAFVTISHIENGSTILHMDENGFGYNGGFQPLIKSGGHGESFVTFTFAFENTTTGLPFLFPTLNANILDIDGSNQVKEFAELNMNNGVSTLMNAVSHIELENSTNRVIARNTAGVEIGGISTSATEVMFQVSGINISTFDVKFGTNSTTGSHASRQYSLYFFNYTLPSSLPVSLINFQATLRDKNATLGWTTTNHYNFSHFVIEKSTDARSFTEAAVLFTEQNTSNAEYSYKYKDNLQNSTAKIVYYRLKMVDVDGTFTYSETRMVRLTSEETKVLISTFPNPVANEVRVMIPTEWQDKAVTYEVFNSSGLLMQRFQTKNAAQVQQLQVQQLNSGTYILKVSSSIASTTSKFIKY
ncbi:T9SS type A sorting domain-containing protein [Lacibacter sp. H407]|uniref:T9SS type A sorting domain-containing protein n=1 Tax=Lacibacter sp. H407 TaxID=3133423 RepID=UPI0030BDA28C